MIKSKVIFKAFRFPRALLSPNKKYLFVVVEECQHLDTHTPYIFDTKTKRIECCPLQSDIYEEWQGNYISKQDFDFVDFSPDETKLAINEIGLLWIYCFEKRAWSAKYIAPIHVVKFIDNNRIVCMSCSEFIVFNYSKSEIECAFLSNKTEFHHVYFVPEHQAFACFSSRFIPESTQTPPANTKNKMFFYLLWLKPTIEKKKLSVSLIGWFNNCEPDDCKEERYGLLKIKEGRKITVVKILDVARRYIEAHEFQQDMPNYETLIYDLNEDSLYNKTPVEIFGEPTKFSMPAHTSRMGMNWGRFVGQVDRNIFHITRNLDLGDDYETEQLEFIRCKNWNYWIFADAIATGLADSPTCEYWAQFLKNGLYDPRLLVLIWAFVE